MCACKICLEPIPDVVHEDESPEMAAARREGKPAVGRGVLRSLIGSVLNA